MYAGRAVPWSLLEADAEVVTPQADRSTLAGHPTGVFDFESFTTEFDVEAARGLHVEGQHLVVDVPAQRGRHGYLAAQRAVQAQADIVGLPHFDHQMHDATWSLAGHEGQAVMTRVDAEEPQPRRRAIGGPAD